MVVHNSGVKIQHAPKVVATEVQIEDRAKHRRVRLHDADRPSKPERGVYRPIRRTGAPSSTKALKGEHRESVKE